MIYPTRPLNFERLLTRYTILDLAMVASQPRFSAMPLEQAVGEAFLLLLQCQQENKESFKRADQEPKTGQADAPVVTAVEGQA